MTTRKNRRVKGNLVRAQENIDRASSLVGTTLGAVLGTLSGGPVAGVILGSVSGEFFKNTIGDIAKRWLTPKEANRIGTAAELVLTNINERQCRGESVRGDAFFTANEKNRSSAEELFEGVLLKSKEEFEEMKIPYLSNIFTHTVFDSTLDPSNANYILTITERLTYRQLTVIALVGQNQDNNMTLRTTNNRPDFIQERPEILNFLYQDFRALNDYGIIRNQDRKSLSSYVDLGPGNLVLTELGKRFFIVLGLTSMPISEFVYINDLK